MIRSPQRQLAPDTVGPGIDETTSLRGIADKVRQGTLFWQPGWFTCPGKVESINIGAGLPVRLTFHVVFTRKFYRTRSLSNRVSPVAAIDRWHFYCVAALQ